MSLKEFDLSDLSEEEQESARLEELVGPLFDLTLRFEKAFARLALDRVDLSDEDAEAAARIFEDLPSFGPMFAYLLRYVKFERVMRRLAHQFDAVRNGDECLSLDEISARYAALEKQGKVGKS